MRWWWQSQIRWPWLSSPAPATSGVRSGEEIKRSDASHRRHPTEPTTWWRILLLQLPLHPVKLSQRRLHRRASEVGAPLFYLAGAGVIFRPSSAFASSGRRSVRSWLPVSSSLHRRLPGSCFYKLQGYQQVFSGDETEAQRRQPALLMARHRWMQEKKGANFLKDLPIISCSFMGVLVRAAFI